MKPNGIPRLLLAAVFMIKRTFRGWLAMKWSPWRNTSTATLSGSHSPWFIELSPQTVDQP
jgi:hypothetical protein